MKNSFISGLIIFVAFISGGLTMYYFSSRQAYAISNDISETNTIIAEEEKLCDENTNANFISNNLSSAIEEVYDATVMINVYKNEKISSTGSGFVYKVDNNYGYILTNHHVVSIGNKLTLYFSDDIEIDAKLLGSDQYFDLAVLRIDKKYVKKVAKLGNSNECKLGESVFSIGSPLGYDYRGTVTNGIISGLNRLVEVSTSGGVNDWVMEVLQTNTAVNPGNSGGPLFNSQGEVIGIVSLKLVQSSIEGMGFAIPINYALEYLDVLENGKTINRPLLGISMVNASETAVLKYEYDIKLDSDIQDGVVVIEITEGSAASNSSLEKGDVITEFDGEYVRNLAYFKYMLYKHNVGDTIELTYYRDGIYKTTKFKLIKNNG